MSAIRYHESTRGSWKTRIALSVCLAVLSLTGPAFALDETTRSVLRQLSSDGVVAYQAEDYATAVEKLDSAWGILQTAPLGLWSGRALEQSGRLVEASERYLAAVRAPLDAGGDQAAQEAARAEAQAARQAIQPRIPKVTVRIEGADKRQAELTLGERKLLPQFVGTPVPVDPGTLEVKGSVDGQMQSASVVLAEGEAKEVTLRFPARATAAPPFPAEPADRAPASSGNWQRIAGWTGIGLGGAGIILGGVTGGILLGKYDDYGCGDGVCNVTTDVTAGLNDLRTVSSIGFIAGGVVAAAGVTLLLTAPRREHPVAVQPFLTASLVGVRGTF